MDMPKKSVSLSLVLTSSWTWKLQRRRQALQAPLPNGSVGLASTWAVQWGCVGLTVGMNSIRPAAGGVQGQLVVPASGLVDARGQALQGRRP